jgi:y4mF family transcriptional regulator
MDPRLNEISRQVKLRRKSLRLTQDELADLAGCSQRFVRSLEAGKQSVRMDKVLAVLHALGLDLSATLRKPA